MKAIWFDRDIRKAAALLVGKLFTRNAAFSPFAPFHYGDIDEPAIPNPRWLKVKNIRCGLCASEIHLIFMDISPKAFPAAVPGGRRTYLGHELVGQTVELGREVEGFAIGDRIAQKIDYPSCSHWPPSTRAQGFPH